VVINDVAKSTGSHRIEPHRGDLKKGDRLEKQGLLENSKPLSAAGPKAWRAVAMVRRRLATSVAGLPSGLTGRLPGPRNVPLDTAPAEALALTLRLRSWH
jgi:hypothetical protein